MNKLFEKIANDAVALGYTQEIDEIEKDATSVDGIRNALAHSIRGMRSLGQAAGTPKTVVRDAIKNRYAKAEDMLSRLWSRSYIHGDVINKTVPSINNSTRGSAVKDVLKARGAQNTLGTAGNSASTFGNYAGHVSRVGKFDKGMVPFNRNTINAGRYIQIPPVAMKDHNIFNNIY